MASDEAVEPDEPTVSFVVPARDEEFYLPRTLASVEAQRTDVPFEVVVVDGGSADRTRAVAREHGARVVEQTGEGVGDARHQGATVARGEWLAFVDADTELMPTYVDAMLRCVRARGFVAASSRCRMPGVRSTAMEAVINYVFPRLGRPILPGFNLFVERETYDEAGGFPNVPNEDTAFSRRLADYGPTGYCPGVLVETSSRRIEESGLTGTLVHYARLDWKRVRSGY